MHVWANGQLLDDPQAPVIGVTDHGLTVGDGVFEALKVVDGQPFALTRHLERLHSFGDRPGASRAGRRGVPQGRRRGARPGAPRAGADQDHLHRRTRAAGIRQGRRDADDGGGRCPDGAGTRDHGGGPGAMAAQRAGGARGHQVHVVRRERGRARRGSEARRHRGDLREPGRQPLRGHRVQRRLRDRGRGPYADPGAWAAWRG